MLKFATIKQKFGEETWFFVVDDEGDVIQAEMFGILGEWVDSAFNDCKLDTALLYFHPSTFDISIETLLI